MTQAAAEELELLMREQHEEDDEAKKKAAADASHEEGDDLPKEDEVDDNEPKAEDIKKQLFEKVGLDPETEEVKKPEPKPEAPVEGQTEEDIKDLPKELTGDNRKLFIQERIKARKQREADAQARGGNGETEGDNQRRPEQTATEVSRREAAAGDDKPLTENEFLTAVAWASKAQAVLDGAYSQDLPEAKAAEILKNANIILAQISDPTMLARLRGKIMTGEIPQGVDMRAALEILDKEMPFVQARAQEIERLGEQQKQAVEKLKGNFSNALKETYEQFPEFKPPVKGAKGSPEHEFAIKTMKELSDYEIQALYADPAKQLPKLMRRIKAEFLLEKNEQLAKENAALKSRMNRSRAPLPGGSSAGSTRAERSTGEESSEDIKRKLEERTGLTL